MRAQVGGGKCEPAPPCHQSWLALLLRGARPFFFSKGLTSSCQPRRAPALLRSSGVSFYRDYTGPLSTSISTSGASMATPTQLAWYGLLAAAIAVPAIFLVVIPTLTLVLATITTLRSRHRFSSSASTAAFRTALFKGRVSHTRYRPAAHSFSYPLFFCVLDLDEVSELFGGESSTSASASATASVQPVLWPLSLLMQFRESDHLKNGEGLVESDGNGGEGSHGQIIDNSIRRRICRLVR